MKRRGLLTTLAGALALSLLGWASAWAAPAAQQITATPSGPQAVVYQEANVRAGPGTDYDLIGKLVPGQVEPILGKVIVGPYTWLKVKYFGGPDNLGWVLSGLVRVVGDLNAVPAAEVPPTPTLPATPTLELGGAATATPQPDAVNRLPTFTPPALAIQPTLLPARGAASVGTFPPALAILILFALGVFAGVVSLVRRG